MIGRLFVEDLKVTAVRVHDIHTLYLKPEGHLSQVNDMHILRLRLQG